MAATKFCSACGCNIKETGGNPDCVKCAPKAARPSWAVITHHAGGRSSWRKPYPRALWDWHVFEVRRETPTMIFDKKTNEYGAKSYNQKEAPHRFATREEAEAFLALAKEYSADLRAANDAAHAAFLQAQEAYHEAHRALGQATEQFLEIQATNQKAIAATGGA